MKKALEVLFGIKPANQPFTPNKLGGSNIIPRHIPNLKDWCTELNVGILADKHSNNVPILMGTRVKYVDLRSIKSN